MAKVEEFVKKISAHQNIMLDTNAIIYFLDGTPDLFDLMRALFELVEQDRLKITLSVISEAELLVKPYREKNSTAIEAVSFFLEEFPNLKINLPNMEISRQAAKIRAESGLRLPDAMIVATAINTQCDLLLGNDIGLMQKASSYLPTVILSEYI
ncbi:MAG: PIN domain-containing protein [Syntrophomonas sp.]|uniref:type II toxin-antitoxin system VapC family toxin n=1 Tax=Syntrophomonas sp. TaxID=2053627 RepID=UPI002602CE34|nr:PIN domain-containing protein [Syntrophomonas sp.]MDD2510467.1 PIN domain-containing protein [Syntrophomonas sp.]MDD3879579.1 PIN domain-containing protein [Syntrophomonas sp.]MDD4627022.1 PIN domain-containing protein [Syntrophomonas sp.]